jgi:hypothetical protein
MMIAEYIRIKKSPKFAPDAKAIIRLKEGLSYRHYYVDGIADARGLCKSLGAELLA